MKPKLCFILASQKPKCLFDLTCQLFAEKMLSLTRAVVGGVVRAPAAVCPVGVTAITRYNSTAQVLG